MPKISPKYALTAEEIEFVKVYLGFGAVNHTEAYRRAYLRERDDGRYVEAPQSAKAKDLYDYKTVEPKRIEQRAATLLAKPHIQKYIAEVERPTSDHARAALAELVLFGKDGESRRAAEEVPLPGNCPECGSRIFARAPVSDMFPGRDTKGEE
jgi:hypothetical protein